MVINSFIVVHNAILIEKLNFKFLAKVNLLSVFISGFCSIWYAYNGGGIWALIVKSLLQSIITTLLLLFFYRWHPRLVFSFRILKELFNYGSKLLVSGFVYTIIGNLSSLLIGKFFHSRQVGYYTRGSLFSDTIASTFQSIIINVSFPALAAISSERDRFVFGARKIINMGSIIICFVLISFALLAKPFVLLVLTEKWLPCVPIIQLLCIARAITSIGIINITMLQAFGRTDLALRVDMLKVPLNLLAILIGVCWGIIGVAVGPVSYTHLTLPTNSLV